MDVRLDDLIKEQEEVGTEPDPFDGESKPNYDKEGFSEEVTSTVSVDLTYPHIEIKRADSMDKNILKAVKIMLSNVIPGATEIPIYMRLGKNKDLYEIGTILDVQVRGLITLVGIDSLVARYSSKKELEGHMIYTLSS